jgi:DNA-binding NarL/FixJ family response regulator
MGNNNCHLTDREIEILLLIAEGMKNNKIADKLYISRSTVNSYKTNLCLKLSLKSTSELVCYSLMNKGKFEKYLEAKKEMYSSFT